MSPDKAQLPFALERKQREVEREGRKERGLRGVKVTENNTRRKKKKLIFAPRCLSLQTVPSFSCLFCNFFKHYRILSSQPTSFFRRRAVPTGSVWQYVDFPSFPVGPSWYFTYTKEKAFLWKWRNPSADFFPDLDRWRQKYARITNLLF